MAERAQLSHTVGGLNRIALMGEGGLAASPDRHRRPVPESSDAW
jgi:hypothetical protein